MDVENSLQTQTHLYSCFDNIFFGSIQGAEPSVFTYLRLACVWPCQSASAPLSRHIGSHTNPTFDILVYIHIVHIISDVPIFFASFMFEISIALISTT
jgi:hypothetical protein